MSSFKIDLCGLKFTRLKVLSFHGRLLRGKQFRSFWNCLCDCGNTIITTGDSLKSQKTQSCGCLNSVNKKTNRLIHGKTATKIYSVWENMKCRCDKVGNKSYQDYGGRGITYDLKWSNFINFYEDMGEKYQEGFTLERLDVNGNYCKDNCEWVPQERQARNKRKMKNNTSGKTGVQYKDSNNSWVATWRRPMSNKPKTKSFSINKYGDELAFFMASEYRDQQILLLNLEGAGYSENHGK